MEHPAPRNPLTRLADLVAGRRTKFAVFGVLFLLAAVIAGTKAGGFDAAQENEAVSFLPEKAESVQALKAIQALPGGERASAVVAYVREGGLTARDRQRIARDRERFNAQVPPQTRPLSPPRL